MKFKLLKTAITGLIVSVSSFANAGLINFNEYNQSQWFDDGLIVQNNGFNIKSTSTLRKKGLIAHTGSCDPTCPDNGGYYLFGHRAGFEFTTVDGLGFSLSSFDGAEAHNGVVNIARQIWVSATTMDNVTVNQYFNLDHINDGDGPLNDFQYFTFSNEFMNLKSARFVAAGGEESMFSIDNINYNRTDVPEPPTLAIFALGMIGLVSRRFKKQ
jgi:hypothetical protein